MEALRCTPRAGSYGDISVASGLSSVGSSGGGDGGAPSSEGSGGGGGSVGGSTRGGAGVFVWSDMDLAVTEPGEGPAGGQAPGSGGRPPPQA